MDLFDPNPDLIRLAGQPVPEPFGLFKTRRNVAKDKLKPPLRPFRPRGQCDMVVSDFLPPIAEHVDDICLLRGFHRDSVTHPAEADKTHVHDIRATILHLPGMDHERLTFHHGGRDERLTAIAGKVIERALA